jgi:probable blue pigment (indigoidine) exporter
MRTNRHAILMTALAPSVWGTTYLVTTEWLPPGRPLLAAVLRALPAGLVLLAITRQLPHGSWWWRAAVLGALNIGAFFALLFVAAYRLPGGVASTITSMQPLLVAALAARLLGERLSWRIVLAALVGILGVALLVLRAHARLDALGIAAAFGAAIVMATGIVLAKRWPSPGTVLATTGCQLIFGGLLILPLALIFEGVPSSLSGENIGGYLYLTTIGAALAYALWFRGIRALSPTKVTFLTLLSPVVATTLGWIVVGQQLTPLQLTGAVLVLVSVSAAQIIVGHAKPKRLSRPPSVQSAQHPSTSGHAAKPLSPSTTTAV